MGRGILVVLPNWVGDGVMAAPALRALAAARPGVPLYLLGSPRSAPLFGRWACQALWEASRPGPRRWRRMIRGLGIEEALVLGPSFRAATIPFVAGIPVRVGYGSDRRGLLLTRSVPPARRDVHLARSWVRLAAHLGADPDAPLDPRIPIGEDERAAAYARLAAQGIDAARSIALCPGATYGPTKRWPEAHWTALGRRLVHDGWSLVLVGGGDEKALCAGIAASIDGGRVANLAGALALRASLATLAVLSAAVSNDSGAMHLASAAGIPVIGLFGSTEPAWTGPLGARSRALTLRLPCAPCFAKSCPTQIECLRDLAPEMVHASLDALLREAA